MAVVSYALCSLSDVKSFLGISVSTYDSLLEILIDSVTDWIESECGGRRFKDEGADIEEVYDGDFDSTGRRKIFLRRYPVNEIDETQGIEFNLGTQGTPSWTKQSREDWTLIPDRGEIVFDAPLIQGKQNIRLSYQGGFTTIPNDLRLACIKMVAKEFDKRNSQGATQESVGGGSVTWNENIDPSAIKLFQKYRMFYHS